MAKHIELVYTADGRKGAPDGGAKRDICATDCREVSYSQMGITASIFGLSAEGKEFIEKCPADCIVEIIGGHPSYYQADVVAWNEL